MKLYKYILAICIAGCLFPACNETSFLEEKPLDFNSPENSVETASQFQASLNYLHNRARWMYWAMDHDTRYAMYYATDFAHNATDYYVPAKLNDFRATMTPTFSVVSNMWNALYSIITNANVVIDRAPVSTLITENDKNAFRAEAMFFRAFAYRHLAHLYGGVPLVLEEIKTPRRDFKRATRDEVYKQCQTDLEEAIKYLGNIETIKDGKISKQVAQHLLSEILISLKDYQGAVNAATAAISHPAMGLMTERFGVDKDKPGDVYSDLFILGNHNRAGSGNKEGLWVLQYEYLNEGSKDNNTMPWSLNPFYQNVTITADGKTNTAFLGVTDMKCGRGVGWMQGTKYFFNEVWGDEFDKDMRNSDHNIIRDFIIDNPATGSAYGKWLVKDGYSKQVDSIRVWYPTITKVVPRGKYHSDFYVKDANGEPMKTAFGEILLQNSGSNAYKDMYMFRLAETYLLRAEAYLGLNQKEKAAEDLNALRTRAQVTPVDASDVTLDFILDERLRELYAEETRMLTLTRLGKLVERTRKYNPMGGSLDDHHNLWPIPFSEIERNTEAVIEQNPGYK